MELNPRGRPTVQTDATEKKILAALKGGNSRTASALLSGISYKTFKSMLDEREGFQQRVEEAEAQCQKTLVDAIRKVAVPHDAVVEKIVETLGEDGETVVKRERTIKRETNVQAAQWLLSRRWPEQWGDRVDVTSGGEKVGVIGITVMPSAPAHRPTEERSESEAEEKE